MTINQALFKAVEEFKSGDVAAAKKLFSKIIKIEPNHSDANNNMGIILLESGNLAEAVPFIKTALESNFNIAQYWFNYIDVLFKLGRFTEALELLAVARDKGCKGQAFDELEEKIGSTAIKFEMHIERFLKLIDQGEIAKVLEESGPLLRDVPGSLSLLNVVSLANEKSGNFNAAVDNYAQILKVIPNSTEAYSNMGNALKAQGKLEEAIAAYAKALAVQPDNAEAYNNMGIALQDQGNLDEAIEAYKKALTIKPDYADAYNNMGNALTGMAFKQPNPGLQKIIISLLDKKTIVRPSDISFAAISLLKFEPKLKQHLQTSFLGEPEPKLLKAITDLSELPLLLKLMSVCPLPDLALENLLRDLRASLLLSISDITGSAEELKFQSALALQCFTNEYIYNQSEHEGKALTALEAATKQTLNNGDQPSPQSILCLASYRPLNQYDWSSSLRS
jgi:tetratricopeptide (TPR) repeat protein